MARNLSDRTGRKHISKKIVNFSSFCCSIPASPGNAFRTPDLARLLPHRHSSSSMREQNPGKRKPFQGKKFHKDLRDFKNQEIKRSLTHRARLRKNYFKLVGSQGEHATPAYLKDGKEKNRQPDSNEESGSGDEQSAKSRSRLPPQKDLQKSKKPMDFAERARLAKLRKEQKREEQLRRVQEKRAKIESSRKEREQKKLSLSKRTKRGQPIMGPKINDLLEKIRGKTD